MSDEKDIELNNGENRETDAAELINEAAAENTELLNGDEAEAEAWAEEAEEAETAGEAETDEAEAIEAAAEAAEAEEAEAAEPDGAEDEAEDILIDNTDGEPAEDELPVGGADAWGEAQFNPVQEKQPMSSGAKAAIAVAAAIIVIAAAVAAFVPQILPFNLTMSKIEDTDDTVRVQEEVLKGSDDEVYYIGGKTYISVSEMSKALGYGDAEGTSVKLNAGGKTVKLARNVKRAGGSRLENRVFAKDGELFIAYDDVTKAFPNLKCITLGTQRKCVYDPVPYVKSGETLQDLFEMYQGYGMISTEEEFREQMGIPAETDLNIDINIFQNELTLAQLAEMNGKTFEDYIQQLKDQDIGLPEDALTAEATVGEVQDKMTVKTAFGTDDISRVVEYYGLTEENIGFEVTADTPFYDIRNIVVLYQLDLQYASEEEAEKEEEAKADDSEPEAQLEEEDESAAAVEGTEAAEAAAEADTEAAGAEAADGADSAAGQQ